jgi:hypothetical protein
VRFCGGLAALAGTACAPSLPPFVSAETADALPARRVTLAAGGGVTVLTTDVRTAGLCCGGGELRARIGLGSRQEVSFTTGAATTDGVWTLSSRAGYKRALAPWLAVTAGVDLLVHDYGRAVAAPGGDLGAIVSVPPGRLGRVQPYGGLHLGVDVPALADPFSGPGVVGVLAAPAGIAVHTSPGTRLYVEGGLVAIHVTYRAGTELESYPLFGGYGALAMEVQLP